MLWYAGNLWPTAVRFGRFYWIFLTELLQQLIEKGRGCSTPCLRRVLNVRRAVRPKRNKQTSTPQVDDLHRDVRDESFHPRETPRPIKNIFTISERQEPPPWDLELSRAGVKTSRYEGAKKCSRLCARCLGMFIAQSRHHRFRFGSSFHKEIGRHNSLPVRGLAVDCSTAFSGREMNPHLALQKANKHHFKFVSYLSSHFVALFDPRHDSIAAGVLVAPEVLGSVDILWRKPGRPAGKLVGCDGVVAAAYAAASRALVVAVAGPVPGDIAATAPAFSTVLQPEVR